MEQGYPTTHKVRIHGLKVLWIVNISIIVIISFQRLIDLSVNYLYWFAKL
jgi:hypothetical protein